MAATMIVAEVVRPGELALRRVPVPVPGPGEVLVRVEAALTCGTDLKLLRRGHPWIPLPSPMGHEFAGTVAAVGAGVTRFKEGDAVACVPTAPCGSCRLCRRGRDSLCPEAVGRMVLGAFGEYVKLPAHLAAVNVFHRPPELPAAHAAAFEPLACVVHGADRVDLASAETVVFVGDGPIAQLFLQVARLRGAGRILVAGRHAIRLEAAAALGADRVVDVGSGSERLSGAVAEWTDGVGADVVVECVGRPEVWQEAAGLAAPAGEVLLYGGCPAGTTAAFDTYRLHYEEVDIKGAFHYGRRDVEEAWRLLAGGAVQVAPLVTHRRPLTELAAALELVTSRQAIKVAIEPAGTELNG